MKEMVGVDVICYGQKKHYESRKKAIADYLENMSMCEGAERDRYMTIYLELVNTKSVIVSDGSKELKKKDPTMSYKDKTKEEIIEDINLGKIKICSREIYDMGSMKFLPFANDRRIALAGVKKEGTYALQYLSDELLDDEEIIFTSVTFHKAGLGQASVRLKDDKDFVLKVVAINGNELKYASKRLQNDFEVFSTAVEQNVEARAYVGEELIKTLIKFNSCQKKILY